MQENEKVAGWLFRGRPETIDLLHGAILAPAQAFCKLPAENGTGP